jgi:hypothetical protein
MPSMPEYASPRPKPRGPPLPRPKALPSHRAYLVACLLAYRVKDQQECLLEAESLSYCPTLPSVYVSRSGWLRWGVQGQVLEQVLGRCFGRRLL